MGNAESAEGNNTQVPQALSIGEARKAGNLVCVFYDILGSAERQPDEKLNSWHGASISIPSVQADQAFRKIKSPELGEGAWISK